MILYKNCPNRFGGLVRKHIFASRFITIHTLKEYLASTQMSAADLIELKEIALRRIKAYYEDVE